MGASGVVVGEKSPGDLPGLDGS